MKFDDQRCVNVDFDVDAFVELCFYGNFVFKDVPDL